MYVLRLFHKDQPAEQRDARLLSGGELSIGRDPGVDWMLEDSGATVSRRHCTLRLEGERVVLQDTSSNGVFLANGERAPADRTVELHDGERLRLGAYEILVERMSHAAVSPTATTVLAPSWRGATPVAKGWTDDAPAAPHRDASLIEAFCEGAKLDASTLSAEDPADLMRRVGAIYQQTVLGLAALMADRDQLKRQNELKRTTIAARDNNPFRWAASRKLAEDLLCSRQSAFLSDAAAVRACFEAVSSHMAGTLAGAEAAVGLVRETLDPTAALAAAKSQTSLLRSPAAAAIDMLRERQERLTEHGVRDAFAQAYEAASEP
jgi:predicted component of type VI protein secretion system